jgi:hypothetical protein
MTYGDKRRLFTKCLALLIAHALELGYECAIAFTKRCADCPIGKKNSLHKLSLAADIDLYKDGLYLIKTSDHQELGDYWKSLHELCAWGGDFKNKDGNHYSITHGGVK